MPRKKKPQKKINGMGSVRQLENGSWEYRFVLGRKPDGRLDQRSRTAPTGGEAVARGQAVISEYRKRPMSRITPSETTMEIWAERWYAVHETEVRRSSLNSDLYTKRIIVNELGPMLLQDIKPSHIKAVLQKKADEGKSSSLISKVRGMLYQMLNEAVIDEIIPSNPVALIKQKKRSASKQLARKDSFTPDEIERIIEAQDGRWISNAVMVSLFSGIREGEMLALETPFVDIAYSSVAVTQSLNVEAGRSVLGPVKSQAALRRAPVAAVAQLPLKRLCDNAHAGVLFHSRIHSTIHMCASGYRKQYYKFIEKIPGVRPLPPHCCRHTCGTMLAAVGLPPAAIQAIMGHSDYRLTANIYTHIQLFMTPEVIEKLKAWGVGQGINLKPFSNVPENS